MFKEKKLINVPKDKCTTISYKMRKKVLKEIFSTLQKNFSSMKLIYAAANYNSSLYADYAAIFKTKNVSGTTDLIVFNVPFCFTDLSTPGYVYCKRTNQIDNFFKQFANSMSVMELSKFEEFLTQTELKLSLDSNSDRYWKREEFTKDIIKALTDLSLRYTKRK